MLTDNVPHDVPDGVLDEDQVAHEDGFEDAGGAGPRVGHGALQSFGDVVEQRRQLLLQLLVELEPKKSQKIGK